jgi:hypothetical protein
MSSNYRILCLSHDPAITISTDDGDTDYRNPNDALTAAANRHNLGDHTNCDLLVGRYSAPLIEAACPGSKTCGHNQHADTWTDAGWLRLLHAAYTRGDDVSPYRLPRCWTRDRVLRLGAELGIACGDSGGQASPQASRA